MHNTPHPRASPPPVSRCVAYHRVAAAGGGEPIAVTAAAFARQLAHLRSRYDLVPLWGPPASPRPAGRAGLAVTFDDGWADNFHVALPVLREFSCPWTVFLQTGAVGSDPRFLTWPQVREMAAAGVRFGGHTQSHPHLTQLSRAAALEEIGASRKAIEDQLGTAAEWFSYPYSDLAPWVEELVLAAGFRYACLTHPGRARPCGILPTVARVGIYGTTSDLMFQAKLNRAGNAVIEGARVLLDLAGGRRPARPGRLPPRRGPDSRAPAHGTSIHGEAVGER
ncbi:MAG: glycosyl transferase family 2 [Phycisphaerales bacterium]|nr:glycosyl transferase family 2 [Phycisphaerales bacterium]